MKLFVDTSALLVLLDGDDDQHSRGREVLETALARGDVLMTHNYVISEACALVQRRLGSDAAVDLLRVLTPQLEVMYVTEEMHLAAVAGFVATNSRNVSLVDRVSFEVMRRERVETAFAFDADFVTAGFRTIP